MKAPLVPVALAIIAGIVASHHWITSLDAWLWMCAASAALVGLSLLLSRFIGRFTLPLTMLVCLSVGGLLHARQQQGDWTHGCEAPAYLHVRLAETPQPRAKSIKAKGMVHREDGRTAAPITVFFRKDSTAATLRYGDRLVLHGYPDTLRRSIYVTSDHYVVVHRDSTSLRARSEAVRMHLLHRMQSGPLPARQSAIAEALTLGWRADIDNTTQAAFRDAGIAHMLAVSGLHVGILAALIGGLLFFLGNERRGRMWRGGAQLVGVWGFATLTGLAPSTVRAALMFSLFIIADSLGRRTPKLNLLAATAILTLLADTALLFDTGWQLSYSAVAGIVLARPVIAAYSNRLWQAAQVSLAATTATLPVTLLTFHRFTPYFLIANVVIVPLAGVMLALSLAYLAAPCRLTAWPLGMMLGAAEWLSALIASLPGAVVEVGTRP